MTSHQPSARRAWRNPPPAPAATCAICGAWPAPVTVKDRHHVTRYCTGCRPEECT